MAYSEEQVLRISNYFLERGIEIEQKRMMGGMCFMLDGKMCCGTHIDKASQQSLLMARVGEVAAEQNLNKANVLPMNFTGRPMKDFLFIEELGLENGASLVKWLDLCVAFNPEAKSSKKKKMREHGLQPFLSRRRTPSSHGINKIRFTSNEP